jgi:hypothetical protein
MTRRATFTQAELTRAIKAAKSAGMTVARCEISPDGRIVLSEAAEAPAEDVFGKWQARREGAVARRSQG